MVDEQPEVKITKEERQKLFAFAKAKFGKDYAANLKAILAEKGLTSTQDMTVTQYEEVMAALEKGDAAPSDKPAAEPVQAAPKTPKPKTSEVAPSMTTIPAAP